jgi:hypothetical protein
MVSKKKIIGLAILAISVMTTSAYASINTTQQQTQAKEEKFVKVFVGQATSGKTKDAAKSAAPSENSKEQYKTDRKFVTKKLADKDPEGTTTAVISLSSFNDSKEIAKFSKDQGLAIKKAYVSIPGQVGRGVVNVTTNLDADVQQFIKELSKTADKNEQTKKDYEKFYKGEYGIFAVTVEASNATLNKLTDNPKVKLVDPHFNEAAIEFAKKENKTVTYIELPEKPDGTK